MAAVLICVMRLDSGSPATLSIVLGAWSVSCVGLRSFGLIVGVSCILCSSAVPGVWSILRVTHSGLLTDALVAPTSNDTTVKGKSHTVEERISMHPHKPHATSQPSRFSHTHRLSTTSYKKVKGRSHTVEKRLSTTGTCATATKACDCMRAPEFIRRFHVGKSLTSLH